MDPISILGLISISAIIIIGLISLRANAQAFLNRAFCYFSISTALWALIVFFENTTKSARLASILTRSDFFMAALAMMFWVLFSWSFKHLGKKPAGWRLALIFSAGLIIALGAFTNLFIKNIHIEEAVAFDPGPLFLLYVAYLLAMSATALTLTAQKYFRSKAVERARALYVLVGFFLTIITILITNVVYPQIWRPSVSVSRIGNSGLFFMMAFSAYAVLRYRLMNVTFVLKRTFSYLAILALMLGGYALIIFLLGNALRDYLNLTDRTVQIIALLVSVLSVFPLKALADRYLNRYLFRGSYDSKDFLKEAEELLSSELDLSAGISALGRRLCEAMGVVFASFLVFSGDEEKPVLLNLSWKQGEATGLYTRFNLDVAGGKSLFDNSNRIVVRDELARRVRERRDRMYDSPEALLREMDILGLSISVPIAFQDQVRGVLLIGDKVNHKDFSTQDVDFLKTLMQRVAYVVDHHRLFEELKHNYEELDQAYVKLKDIDRFKSDIITITNHELRGPLTLIKGYLDLLNARMESFDERKRHELLTLAKKGADRLAQIVDDLRVVTDIETGRIYIDPDQLNLREIALEAEASIGAQLPVRFEYDFEDDLPSIYGDREKVAVVFRNLMDNAFKFAGKYGPINVGASAAEDGVVVFVKDQGPGMRKEYLDSIFGLFSFIGDSDHHSEEGLGLGLYIARKLVEMHEGRIWGESELDKGSSFFFFLPGRPVTKPVNPSIEARLPGPVTPGRFVQGEGETVLRNLQDGSLGLQG